MRADQSRTPEQLPRAIRITAVPRTDHHNSGLQALFFASHYGDEVWALPAPGRYVGTYGRVRFSFIDSLLAKGAVPARIVRAFYMAEIFARVLFRSSDLFFVHSFLFALPLWLLRRRYCIFIHGSDRRFLRMRWGRSVARSAIATYGVGFGTNEGGTHVIEVPNIFIPVPSEAPPAVTQDVLFVLRNAPVKNPLYPLDLAEALGEKLGLRITVVGVAAEELSSVDKARLTNLADRGVHIKYEGRQTYEEVVKWMRTSRVLMIPSLSEGLPKALLEGMSQGMHVVINSPLVFVDEIMNRVDRLDIHDWQSISRTIERCRLHGRDEGNIHFAREYLLQSQRTLFELYDRHYETADA